MTNISYKSNGVHNILLVQGHADYNPGNDIVCSAVSTLTYAFMNALDSAMDDGKVTNLYEDEKDGDIEIEFDNISYPEDAIELVINGYEMISERFPENVSIERWGEIIH